MSRAHDLAWAAGFFDGEGYVTIYKKVVKPKKETHKEYINHRLRIGLNHVAPEPVYELSRILVGMFIMKKSQSVKTLMGITEKIDIHGFFVMKKLKKFLFNYFLI